MVTSGKVYQMQTPPTVTSEVTALSVAVVVGNEILCRGIEAVLRSLPAIGSVYRCASGDEAVALFQAERFDFVIVAPSDAGWLENGRRPIANAGTMILLLVDESSLHDPAVYAAMPVDGFLSQQDLSADTLHSTFHRCQLGELPMPRALTRALLAQADEPARGQRTRGVNLTGREMEALELLVKGLSNKQIARRLSISSHGAKRLVASVMLKLDSPNRTAAAVNAIRAGIVECSE
jgi:two-component system, NarL family, nitrate/nitrite response regulator NarL